MQSKKQRPLLLQSKRSTQQQEANVHNHTFGIGKQNTPEDQAPRPRSSTNTQVDLRAVLLARKKES
jgi:hypothetical protein